MRMLSQGRSRVQAALLCAGLCAIGAAQETDTAALGPRVQALRDAYARQDTDAILALWSRKSPQFARQSEQLRKLFASVSEIREEMVGGPGLSGNHARIRVNRDLVPKTAGASSSRRLLVVEWVKEPEG